MAEVEAGRAAAGATRTLTRAPMVVLAEVGAGVVAVVRTGGETGARNHERVSAVSRHKEPD